MFSSHSGHPVACPSRPPSDITATHCGGMLGVIVAAATGSPPAVARRQSPWRCIWSGWETGESGEGDKKCVCVSVFSSIKTICQGEIAVTLKIMVIWTEIKNL